MLDNFKEWLSDNLRYIVLGLSVLAILVLLFFGVKALSGVFADKEEPSETVTERSDTSDNSDESDDSSEQVQETDPETDNPLKKNAYPEINTVIDKFYMAWGNKDVETMRSITDNFDAADEAKVLNSTYIESYSNINIYTKQGLTEGSYVVFVSYDLNYTDVSTPAPGLARVYIKTNEDGELFIYKEDEDSEVTEYIGEILQHQDVQELITSVQAAYQEALESDEALRALEEQLGSETTTSSTTPEGALLTAINDCNIRAEATSDSEKIAQVPSGEQVTKLENAENGWIKVEYEDQTGYIRGDLVK